LGGIGEIGTCGVVVIVVFLQCEWCSLQPAEADAVLFLVCLSVCPASKIIDFMFTGPLDLFRVHFE